MQSLLPIGTIASMAQGLVHGNPSHSNLDFARYLNKGNTLVSFKSVYMGPTSDRTGIFSCVPSLPGWSFLRLIYGGVLPPPADPLAFAWGQGFPP
jgi:hypothetical protein